MREAWSDRFLDELEDLPYGYMVKGLVGGAVVLVVVVVTFALLPLWLPVVVMVAAVRAWRKGKNI